MTRVRATLAGLLLLLLLAGCGGGAFGGLPLTSDSVSGTTVSRQVRYFDEGEAGPAYTFSVTVPESWVGRVTTTSNGSLVTFNYVTDAGRAAPLFTIHTLSESQYWAQNGNEPTRFGNLAVTRETYFIYNVPLDAYYSGLPKAQFDALVAEIPAIVASFSVQPG
ncbi:MAG: hypothetical protein MUE40_05000 [Anaerolineae bacterium]|nr:hypothetical protein [Anaerolineae bacterium]